MDISSISIEPEENITIMKALEYLAYEWEPYADDDEFIVDAKRINKRVDNYFFTDNDMIKAVAKLSYLIRNREIKLNPNDIIPVKQNLYTSSLITSPDNYIKINVSANTKNIDVVENGSIQSVQIRYLKIDDNALPTYLNNKSLTRISTDKTNCYYIPICIIDYGFSKFIYPDCNGIIKFSELEQYKEVKVETRGRNPIISDHDFFMCFLNNIDKILSKDKVSKKDMNNAMMKALEKQYPNNKISDSTVKGKIRPYLNIFDGKYIEIHNR